MTIPKVAVIVFSSARHVLITDVEENEEAFVVRRVGFVGAEHVSDLLERYQVDDVDVDLLGNRRRMERMLNNTVVRPRSGIDIQVSLIWTQTHSDNMT